LILSKIDEQFWKLKGPNTSRKEQLTQLLVV
jgi:hypothetical protein